MTKNSEFEQRLARINAKRPAAQQSEMPAAPTLYPAPKATLPLPILGTALGLVLMAGVVGYAWDDIAIMFPKPEEGRKVTYLESSLRDSMSAEEIKRMNNNPEFEGMTQMQKMILSH